MRVVLINPPRIQPKTWGKPCVFQPLDIAYIAAVLEKKHEAHIIDAPTEGWQNLTEMDATKYRLGLSNQAIADKIRAWSPNMVGITVPFSGWWKTAFEVASTVKSVDRKVITVLTGLHPSVKPEDCLNQPNVDFVVIGEAEYTMLELANALEEGKTDLSGIRGIAYKINNKITFTKPRPLIENLDTLPFPARHLLPMDEYFAAVKKRPVRGEVYRRWARMITSRGCPNNCIFCSNRIVWGKKWRPRSPENVVDEIEELVRTYLIKQLDFDDDNLTQSKERMERICDLIIQRNLHIQWYTPNGVRADTLDENLLAKMKASGCKRIIVAPESGVQRIVNDVLKKNQSLKKVEEAVIAARKVGIKVSCFFIMGVIGETKKDMQETIKFAWKLRKLGADRFYFSVATPLYGTELYEQARKGGYLKSNFSDEALSAAEPLIETPEFTTDELQEICGQANMVNPTFTKDRLLRAMRDPKRAIRLIAKKTKIL